ncbi:MAG: helix-turn-helix transcriptional regulator, partial [Ilumatobacteraceae bacterium]
MNRLDRLYALVEELRAAGSPGRNARRLAERFEVSVRTIERDILALQEAGVPISTQLGRRGGYLLDRSMTLPPLNFTPAEAAALAVGLRRLDDTPWARDARTALLKVVAGMPERAAARARTLVDGVRLLVQPLSAPDQTIADAVVRAVEEATPI